MTAQLVHTTADEDTLEALEDTIGKGLQSFVDVGEALLKVRDSGLYTLHAQTFAEYLDRRWSMSESRAYQLAGAAFVVSTIVETDPDAPVPANEAQARALAPLKDDPAAMVEAMTAASEATGGRPTAAAIAEAVDEIQPADLAPPETAEEEVERKARTRCEKAHRAIEAVDSLLAKLALVNETDFFTEDIARLFAIGEDFHRLNAAIKIARRKS